MFFYFFESRRNPEKGEFLVYPRCHWVAERSADDVMMWINGGSYTRKLTKVLSG